MTNVARPHETTRWFVCAWRRERRTARLVVPESRAALPVFAELVVEGAAAERSAEAEVSTGPDIAVGYVVIRVGARTDEVLLAR